VGGVRAEGTGSLFEFGVKAGEGITHDADDDGGIVEDVGEEDICQRRNAECRRQNEGKQSTLTEEGVEGSGNDDCREHEGDGGEGTQERFAVKVEAGEKVSGGESEDECEEGGESCLIKREKQNMKRRSKVIKCQGVKVECESKDAGKRKKESNNEEG